MAFFFKVFPDIVLDGRLFIAEPPLYRVDDKKDPFVINKADYIQRYVRAASKDYKIGYKEKKDDTAIVYLKKDEWINFLSDTSMYVQDIQDLVEHYKVNDRLLEIILEEFAHYTLPEDSTDVMLNKLNMNHLMSRIELEFPELYFDESRGVILGSIDARQQLVDIDQALLRRSMDLINILRKWGSTLDGSIVLKNNRTGMESDLSLLGVLKILRKYQPDILHRFKGLIARPYLFNCWKFLVGSCDQVAC